MNMIIRELDKDGRISLNPDLLELCGIKKKTKAAICKIDANKLAIRKLDEIKGYKVIACMSIDEKGRIIIPQEIREEGLKFEIYAMDGSLILEEAH